MMPTFIAEATVRSSALIVAVWVLLKVCRMRDAGGEKLAWTLVVAASLAMPLLRSSIIASAMPPEIVPGRFAGSISSLADLSPGTHPLSVVVLTVYFLGVAIFAGRLGAGLLIGARLCRDAQRASASENDIDVRLSTEVQGPMSFGWTVLLPAYSVNWDARTLRAVLAHEREHIRNHDAYRLWLASLCRAMFWFNPLVHWLYRHLTILSELTSDSAAVVIIGDRSAYVNVLLQVATGAPSLHAAVPMARRSTLPRRVHLLLASYEPAVRLPGNRRVLLGSVVLLLGAMIVACAAKPVPLTGTAANSVLRVVQAPTIAGLRNFYPSMLRRRHIQGRVLVRITVDASGRVVHTSIAKESPVGVGLGAAAQSLARAYRFNNSLHRTVITTLPVRFILHHSPSGSPPATAVHGRCQRNAIRGASGDANSGCQPA